MAMRNERQGLPFEDEDRAVKAALEEQDPLMRDMERRRRARGMTPGQRRKAARDAARNKMTVDLPVEVEEELRRLAQAEGVSLSALTALLILYGLEELREGRIDLRWHKRPVRSPRFEWGLDLVVKKE